MADCSTSAAAGPGQTFAFELPFPPLLDSWERNDHPTQVKLHAYHEALREIAAPALEVLDPPLALTFHAAGRTDIAAGCDLDNFLTPVMKALGGGEKFGFVAATKGTPHEPARLSLFPAADAPLPFPPQGGAAVLLTMSPERREWKQTIAAAVGRHAAADRGGPIELEVVFRVSPSRNWVTLWKPAVDALGGVLGESTRAWHPRDDRISLLVLRRILAPELGWSIELEIAWRER